MTRWNMWEIPGDAMVETYAVHPAAKEVACCDVALPFSLGRENRLR